MPNPRTIAEAPKIGNNIPTTIWQPTVKTCTDIN